MEQTPELHPCCRVCGSSDIRNVWIVNSFHIAHCNSCSVKFVSDNLTMENLSEYYIQSDETAYSDENRDCLSHYYRKVRQLIDKRHPGAGRILDVGCSAGWFFDEMTGWECHGTEFNGRDAEIARVRHGDRMFVGSFEDYPETADFFDVITFQDVLDHFMDPRAGLEKCFRMLKPGGMVLIKVHDFSCLYARLTGSKFYAVIPPFHLSYFTRKGLFSLVNRCGFKFYEQFHLGHLLQIKTVFYRLSRGRKTSLARMIFKMIQHNRLGQIRFHKNLHDIMTVIAIKP